MRASTAAIVSAIVLAVATAARPSTGKTISTDPRSTSHCIVLSRSKLYGPYWYSTNSNSHLERIARAAPRTGKVLRIEPA